MPFYSQRVDWNGEDSGFPNQAEINKWQSNCCGIACARMIIDYFSGVKVGYWELLQKGLERKAYIEIGWIHKGLIDLTSDYGIVGESKRNQTIIDLKQSIEAGNICIASVTALFRGGEYNKELKKIYVKGGHLVVAFAVSETGIICNHPSSRLEGNHSEWNVSFDLWEKSFSGNFMEFKKGGS